MSNIQQGNKNDLTTPRQYDNNCLNKFIDELGSDITGACMVPVNLPKKEVINIINRAKKWFRKNYEYSVRSNYYYIPSNVFETDEFKQTRTLYFPKEDENGGCGVYSVFGVYDTLRSYNSASGGLDQRFQSGSDFSMNKMLFKGAFRHGTGIANSAQSLEYYTINNKLLDMHRQMLEHPLSFEFSRLTGELKFTGENPMGSIVLEVYETIEDCALYEDEAFFRYVSGKIKQSIGSKTGIFKMNLPGNAEFDYKEIKDMGKEEVKEVTEEIKNDEGVDWFFHS